MSRIFTAVAGFDLHFPETDWKTWRALLAFLRHVQPSLFVAGGDWLNCESISPHTKGKPGRRERGQMKREFEGFDRKILRPLEAALPESCHKVYLIGNHEDWLRQLEEEQPELEGMLGLEPNLRLTERGWEVIECGKSFSHGKLTYIHGDVLKGGQHNRKALEQYCCNILYGHFHTASSQTKILPHDKKHKWMSWSSPILGKLDQNYLRNAPTGWVNGFNVIEYHDNGMFNLYPVVVMNGQFIYGGKVFRG